MWKKLMNFFRKKDIDTRSLVEKYPEILFWKKGDSFGGMTFISISEDGNVYFQCGYDINKYPIRNCYSINNSFQQRQLQAEVDSTRPFMDRIITSQRIFKQLEERDKVIGDLVNENNLVS